MLTYREKKIENINSFGIDTQPNQFLSIRNLLLNEVSNQVDDDVPVVKEIVDEIKQEIAIYPSCKRDSFSNVAGADAGSHILPLASRCFGVISALVYSLPSGSRFFLEPESLCFPYKYGNDGFGGIINTQREAKLFETAAHFIESDSTTQLLLIDGPLAFSNWWSKSGRETDRKRLIDAVKGLLDNCNDRNVIIAGVVKRPSARYLIYHLGLQKKTELSDSFLLLHTLKPGERTDIFSPKFAIQKALKSTPIMDAIGYSIYSFYIRLSSRWEIPPIRIDLPTFCLSHMTEVADYCFGSSIPSGIPLPIVKADEEVKITKKFIGEIYRDIVGRVGKISGNLSHLAPYWGDGTWMGI